MNTLVYFFRHELLTLFILKSKENCLFTFISNEVELVFGIKMIGDEVTNWQTRARSNNNPAPKQRGSQLACSTFLSIFSHNLDIEKRVSTNAFPLCTLQAQNGPLLSEKNHKVSLIALLFIKECFKKR